MVTDVEMEGVHESLYLKEELSINPLLVPSGHVIGEASGEKYAFQAKQWITKTNLLIAKRLAFNYYAYCITSKQTWIMDGLPSVDWFNG